MENQQLLKQNSLNKSLNQLEATELEDNLKASLVVVMQRLDMEFSNINATIYDIVNEFHYLKLKDVIQALRNGSLGNYGRTYKLSTQEVCIWIRKFTDTKNTFTI